ncbi:hypothetical protein TIFTF001_024190 [Ficus carica]|uniref:Uncharacterized protein n=1 Tax=Ficus carica TaxID=3494 RepID=A0AA88APK6_FICCA|nr:hypothetical protein TIFTF001_024190 [Ficus carica]
MQANGPWLKERLDTGLGFSIEPSTKPVEDLWCVYQACLVEEAAAAAEEEEDENQKLKKLLMDKFEQGLQLFLSELSDFHENIPSYFDLKVFTKSRRTCSYSSLELLGFPLYGTSAALAREGDWRFGDLGGDGVRGS